MTTLLFLHAHPDDESILTGATIAKAKAAGARVVVAFATRGDAGETNEELGDETLGERREREARAACDSLGVDRVIFLAFQDSGMEGTETTADPQAFTNVGLDEITARLAITMVAEDIDAIVGYDANGHYGHPDHIKVHEAARAAAEAVHANWIVEVTYDRERFKGDNSPYENVDDSFGSSTEDITHIVRGQRWSEAKLTALMHHVSQVPEDFDAEGDESMDQYLEAFSQEWHIITAATADADFAPLAEIFEPLTAEYS